MGASRAPYPTDLSDAEWQLLAPLIPVPKTGGRPAVHERREIVNALAYWLRAGCAWRLLPHDFPPWQTVYWYWRTRQRQGRWEQILARLREGERTRLGRDPTPSAGVLDSQSVKATDRGGLHGYDGGKRVNGIKRHLLVDTLGIVLKVCVSPASVDDRDAAMVLLSLLGKGLTRLRQVWADAGYQGPFVQWANRVLGITVAITRRRDGGLRHTWAPADAPPRSVPRFVVVPRRWVVERTFGWFGRWRRLSKDYEYLTVTSENVVYLVMALILVRRGARAAA
ncbi:IS5 family transposase [Dactylosporangium sp. CA-152071]|uniref:IS5 family transposase n=1 Tax=Dactylosporangium sp. CA-152071 TaxID=3239933 RepID=UPI003D8B43BC